MEHTKTCYVCSKTKLMSNFPNHKRYKDGKLNKCKSCKQRHDREFYNKDIEISRAKCRKKQKTTSDRNSQFLWNYLKENSCIDCGESNPIVLEFDHRDNVDKVDTLANLRFNSSIKKLKIEINKCTVRCANCHRIRTANQLGWYARIKK